MKKFYQPHYIVKARQRIAFSLAELMTIVGVISILSLIAIPSYRDYINTTKVGAAISILNKLESNAKILFDSGDLGASLEFNGITLTSNVSAAADIPPVKRVMYIRPNENVSVPADDFVVCVYIGELNFTNYIEPTNINDGAYSRLCKQVHYTSSKVTTECGSLNNTILDLPTTYSPLGCKCQDIWGSSCTQ